MINSNELLYVVDEYDMPLEPRPRHEAIKNGHWHRAVHVWIVNDKNQVLCQKRSLLKDMGPGKWEPTVSGHLGPDDNYFTGAVREIKEETGLTVDPKDLQLLKIYKNHDFKEYRGIFFCKSEAELHHIQMEPDEVSEVKFIDIDVLKSQLLEQESEEWIQPEYAAEMFLALY